MGKWDDWTNFIKANNGTDGRTIGEFYADLYKPRLEEAKTREDIDKILNEIEDKKLNEHTIKHRWGKPITDTKDFNENFDPDLEAKTNERNIRDIIKTATNLRTLRDLDIKLAGMTRSAEEQKTLHKRLAMIKGQNLKKWQRTIDQYSIKYDRFRGLSPVQLMKKTKGELRASFFPKADIDYIKATGKLPIFRAPSGDATLLIAEFKKERKILS